MFKSINLLRRLKSTNYLLGLPIFLDMSFLAINYHLVMEKPYKLSDYFAISPYRTLIIKIV